MQKHESGNHEDNTDKKLRIVAKDQKSLSKNQQLFNQLTLKIETLEQEILQEHEKLARILKIQIKEILPTEEKVALLRIQLAITLEKAMENHRFSKNQEEDIRKTILALCQDAFEDIEATAEQLDFYNKWKAVPAEEETEFDDQETNEDFYDSGNFETEDFQDNYKEKRQQQQYHFQQKRSQKRQSNAEKIEESIQNKSIRSVYIALAKILHPDTEPDSERKAGKEEIMKQVTAAYNQKDLSALLKLEMEWIYQTNEHLKSLPDEKLLIYISALKQQAEELTNERTNLYRHPRYQQVSAYSRFPERYAVSEMRTYISELKRMEFNLNGYLKTFVRPDSKKEITAFVNEYCQDYEENESSDYWE